MILGIFFGILAATAQSASYIFSKRFVEKFHQSTIYLLTLSHLIMGCFSIILIVFIWPTSPPPLSEYAIPTIGASLFYVLGQASLFLALKHTAASRAAPLLGLKVVILAMIGTIFLSQSLTSLQWVAILLNVIAAFILNYSGGSMPTKSIIFVLLACLFYSLSDINIKAQVACFDHVGITYAATIGVCLCFILLAVVSVFFLFFLNKISIPMWQYAIPYSISWFLAMIFLFSCFGSIGVVFGNIVQSSRGLISILLGSLVAAAGHVHIEEKVPMSVFVRRAAAAVLMAGAITLFYMQS
jgi:drug/metabolite transporter (DMT)-like permease